MAEKIALKLDIDAKGATTSLGQLEEEAERLNKELRKVPLGSKAFNDLKTELIGVNKEIKNTELSMEALDNEQVASELGSVAGAVGDVSAAFVLFGGSGGALEGTVQSIQKAIGVSMAFKGIIEGVSSSRKLFNNLLKTTNILQKINNVTTIAATKIFKFFGRSVKTTSFAFKALKTAIISTGIGALVLGIMEGISALTSFISSSDDAEKQQERFDASIERTNDRINAQSEAYDKLVVSLKKEYEIAALNLKLKGEDNAVRYLSILQAEEEIEIKKKEIKQLNDQADGLKTLAGNRFMVNSNTKEYNHLLKQSNVPRKEAIKQEAILVELEHKKTVLQKKNKIAAMVDARAAVSATQKEAEKTKKKDDEARFKLILARKEANAKSLEDFIAIEKLKRNHLLKNEQLTKYERILIRFKTEEEILKISNEFAEKASQNEAERLQRIEDNAKQHKQNLIDIENDFRAELEIETDLYNEQFISQQELEIQAVEEKYFRLKELAKQNGEDATQLEFNEQKAKDKINEEFAQKELDRQIALENSKLSLAADGVSALINLTKAFAKDNEKSQKRAFEINKRLQIAQAIIQTYQGANAIFASAAANPKTVLFPAQPFIAAGIAIANGLANVATISKQQFQSSSPGGGGNKAPDFSGGGGTAPQLSPVTNTSTIIPQEPSQVFVTETDITNTQNQVNVIQGQATLN